MVGVVFLHTNNAMQEKRNDTNNLLPRRHVMRECLLEVTTMVAAARVAVVVVGENGYAQGGKRVGVMVKGMFLVIYLS